MKVAEPLDEGPAPLRGQVCINEQKRIVSPSKVAKWQLGAATAIRAFVKREEKRPA